MAKERVPEKVAARVLARAQTMCEFMIPGVCTGMGVHLHHRKISGREHRVSNMVLVCMECHRYVHAHPAEAYGQGWLVKMNYGPEQVAFSRRGRLSFLDDEGGVEEVILDAEDSDD